MCRSIFFITLAFFFSFRKRTYIINDRQRLMNPEKKGTPIIKNINNKNEMLINVYKDSARNCLALTVRVTAFQT